MALDIGELTIKAVQLKRYGQKAKIVSWGETSLPEGCIQYGEIKDQDQFKKSLEKLLQNINGKKIKNKNVISVLPEQKTFIKSIKIDDNGEELRQKRYQDGELIIPEMIIRETEEHIPLPIKEIYLDWQIVNSKGSTEILIGAAPKSVVNNYIGVLKFCGLQPIALEIESMAITRSLFALNKMQSGAKMIIDLGLVRTSLIIYDNNNIKFTVSLPISGKNLTQNIAQKLKISFDKAEKAKYICGLNSNLCQGIIKNILDENIRQLCQKIKEAINFYHDHFVDVSDINEIIICGGGANLIGLEETLAQNFAKIVRKTDSLVNIGKFPKTFNPADSIHFTTAIGLALRAAYDKDLIY